MYNLIVNQINRINEFDMLIIILYYTLILYASIICLKFHVKIDFEILIMYSVIRFRDYKIV